MLRAVLRKEEAEVCPPSAALLARVTTLALLSVLMLLGVPLGRQDVQAQSAPGGILVASGPSPIIIHNAPRTAVVGQTERFWALLPGQPHALLIYVLRYPDGHAERIPVRTDSHGSASYTFRVRPYAARHVREAATLSIEDTRGRVLAFTHFAMQSPSRRAPATRTATATSHPAITAIRGFSLIQSSGAGLSSVAVSGSGFTPDGPITLTFDRRRVATSCTADATGNFRSCAFTVPAVIAGTHTLAATDRNGKVAAAHFTV
jgi:hypothetical protein